MALTKKSQWLVEFSCGTTVSILADKLEDAVDLASWVYDATPAPLNLTVDSESKGRQVVKVESQGDVWYREEPVFQSGTLTTVATGVTI